MNKFCKIFMKKALILLKIDFFSVLPSSKLTFKQQKKYSTNVGIFSSWLIILLFLFFFYTFATDMFMKKNPDSKISENVLTDPYLVSLTQNNFFFAFGLQDSKNFSKHFIDESIYEVEILQRTKIGTAIKYDKIKVERCNLVDVPKTENIFEYFKNNQIENLYCIKNDSIIIPELKGNWDNELYKNILINVKSCDNKTRICESVEKIQNMLNYANFAIYFTNLAIDVNNFENPIVNYGKQIFTPISFSSQIYMELVLGNIKLISDEGTIFTQENTIKKLMYKSARQTLSLFRSENENTNFVQIDIKLDKIETFYYRTYKKLQQVFANLLGLLEFIILFLTFCVNPLIKFGFSKSVSNEIFSYKFKNNKDLESKKDEEKNERKLSETNNLKINTDPEKIKKLKINSKKFNMSYFEYVCSCFFISKSSKTKKKLLKKGINLVNSFLDIKFIMNKFIELDKLKMILLDKNQLHLFDYLPKPVLSINKEKNKLSKINNSPRKSTLHKEWSLHLLKINKNNSYSEKKALVSLTNITQKKTKNDIDIKLLEMFSPRIKINENSNESTPNNLQNKFNIKFSTFQNINLINNINIEDENEKNDFSNLNNLKGEDNEINLNENKFFKNLSKYNFDKIKK